MSNLAGPELRLHFGAFWATFDSTFEYCHKAKNRKIKYIPKTYAVNLL